MNTMVTPRVVAMPSDAAICGDAREATKSRMSISAPKATQRAVGTIPDRTLSAIAAARTRPINIRATIDRYTNRSGAVATQ